MSDKQTQTARLNPSWIKPERITIVKWPSTKRPLPPCDIDGYETANELALRVERQLKRSAPS